MEGELVAQNAEIEHWKHQIVEAWQTSVAHVIKTGLLIQQAKQALGISYRELEQALPFTASTATYLIKIAGHSVLSNPIYQKSLPNSYNTLYQLTQVDEDLLIKEINSGTINPTFRLEDAKKLKRSNRTSNRAGGRKSTKQSKPQFAFGSVSIGNLNDYKVCREELLDLLKKYEGSVHYTLKKDSVGEWHFKQASEQAEAEISTIEHELRSEEFLLLEKIISLKKYLRNNERSLEKRTAQIEGREYLVRCLPHEHPNYTDFSELLETTDISVKHVDRFWSKNKLSRVDSDRRLKESRVKIWKLVLEFCEAKGDKSILKKIQKIYHGTDDDGERNWIREVLDDITAFSNKTK
jgi:hypothetical protein